MDWLNNVIGFITENVSQVLQVVGIFAIAATWTKNKSDDKIVQWLYDIVNFLGMNLGKAKNDPSK